MAKELMEIGGFITEGAEIVNHDNTLSGNGTVDSPLGLNETVLWSGTKTGLTTATLSESLSNFKKARIKFCPYYTTSTMPTEIKEFIPEEGKKIICLSNFVTPNKLNIFKTIFSYNGTTFTIESQYYFDGTFTASKNDAALQIYEIVGINRKA